jgi:hypothetical protein
MEARLSKFAEHQAAEEPQTPFGFSAWEGYVPFRRASALRREQIRAFLLVGVPLSLSGAGSNSKGCRTNANLCLSPSEHEPAAFSQYRAKNN